VIVAAERHYIRGQKHQQPRLASPNSGYRGEFSIPTSSSQHTWTDCAFSSRHRSGVVLRQRRFCQSSNVHNKTNRNADRGFYPKFEAFLVFCAVTGHDGTSLKTTTTSPTFEIVTKHLFRPLSHHNGEIARVPAEGEYGYAYRLDGIKCQSFATI
jgi:hypothetical protein